MCGLYRLEGGTCLPAASHRFNRLLDKRLARPRGYPCVTLPWPILWEVQGPVTARKLCQNDFRNTEEECRGVTAGRSGEGATSPSPIITQSSKALFSGAAEWWVGYLRAHAVACFAVTSQHSFPSTLAFGILSFLAWVVSRGRR